MAGRFQNPFPEFYDDAGNPREGCKLFFFLSETNTKEDTFRDPDTVGGQTNLNPIVLDEYGRPEHAIFLKNVLYKVILAKPTANDTLPTGDDIIWTADPVSASDFATFSQMKVGSGNPNGMIAGTAGSAGVLPTQYWDYTGEILYFCTATGSAVTAEWTAINSAATVAVPPPQGRLTLVTGTPMITTDQSGATAIYYTPYIGNLVPIYSGSAFTATVFQELSLGLVSQHVASALYDIFVFNNSGVLTLVTGPAWQTATAGSGARGVGASSTALARVDGFWVNAVTITGRNGATTYSIGANLATYLGTVAIDGTQGQTSCHVSWGQSRKWGLWNAYNRIESTLKMGDATASWVYGVNTVRQSRATAGNTVQLVQGLVEDLVDVEFGQTGRAVTTNSNAEAEARIGVGVNSTTVSSGKSGTWRHNSNATAGTFNGGGDAKARHIALLPLGMNNLNALEWSPSNGGSNTFEGTEANMMFSARFKA